MIHVTTAVRVERPLEEVFAYVREPRNLPVWNSAVTNVREGSAGGSYVMERDLPGGTTVDDLEVVDLLPGAEVTLRTTSGPSPFVYRIRLTTNDGATVVTADVDASFGRAAELAGPLATQLFKRGVQSNLRTLKRALEQ